MGEIDIERWRKTIIDNLEKNIDERYGKDMPKTYRAWKGKWLRSLEVRPVIKCTEKYIVYLTLIQNDNIALETKVIREKIKAKDYQHFKTRQDAIHWLRGG